MELLLKSCGNPDYYQDPDRPISDTMKVNVDTLKMASDICREYILEYDLGGGNWIGGQVTEDNKQIAKISYNGRIWDNKGQEICQ